MREFITTLLMGIFFGILIGLWIGYHEISKRYEADLARLRSWNNELKKISTPIAEVKIPKEIYPQKK